MAYTIGLIFVLIIILISIDDLLWDMFYFFQRIRGKINIESIEAKDIENTPPKMLAIMVAAYNEENVLKPVIRNIINSNQYPRSMYHIFLGVYPNDPGTMRVAKELEEEFENVHKIVHVLDGPSSKADNINNIIKNIFEFEEERKIKFSAVIVHDSEDLVHPYEFKLENYLLEKHAVIQMPVFPLQQMPKLSNVIKNMVSGTYADEFAENHYRLLVARTATDAFVPSAGTGFVIRRDVLDSFPDHDVFPVGSLTEDYKLSLQLRQKGFNVHYALEDVSRLRADGTVAREFISTRSMFPSTYSAAVRQKTRWIYGITIQSFKLGDIFRNKELNFSAKYSLYRDWKAKLGNLLLGPGYIIFAYFILSLFFDLPTMYPKFTFSWYLMVFLSIMMVQRQILRFSAVKNVYGLKSALVSSVFPPLLPIRMVIGNIINFHSTLRAWSMHLVRKKNKKSKRKPKWSKTDHEFLEEEILLRFRRNLGDTLLYKGLIGPKELDEALKLSKENNERLGITLNRLGLVTEKDIVESVCEITQNIYTNKCLGALAIRYKEEYDLETLMKLNAVPIFKRSDSIIVLATMEADKEKIQDYFKVDNISFVYTTTENLNDIWECSDENSLANDNVKKVKIYLENGFINMEQAILALRYGKYSPVDQVLKTMGIVIPEQGLNVEAVLE